MSRMTPTPSTPLPGAKAEGCSLDSVASQASPASPSPSHESVASEISSVPGCANCGEWDFSPNVEAYEETGELMCDECFEEMCEANRAYEREDSE